MLRQLTISHYALIEHLDLEWQPGFSVITGETGAGKSIMLGALNLLLGGRADAKAIQPGHKKCMVEATFQISGLPLEEFFRENDIDYDADECIVRREVMQTGKSRAFVNDVPVAAAKLKEIGASLIDIHSQHQNLLIRDEHFLLDVLDLLASEKETLPAYRQAYEACRQAETALKQLQTRAAQGRKDQEYMQFQLTQIEEAALSAEEQEQLEQEQHLLAHTEDIKQALFQAQGLLNNEETSLSQNLRQAAESLHGIAGNYPDASALADRLRSLRIELDDIEAELEQAASRVDYDPARLQFVEERLSTIYELEQKHSVQHIAELLAIAERLRAELDAIDNVDEDIRLQTEQVERLRAARNQAAALLTAARQSAAHSMEGELAEALRQLGMPHVRLEVQLSPRTEPDTTGTDNVTFLFSANKNMPMQDISQTASGGEIARLMLALKALIARRTQLPTIVFDEIDTGVSGTMADRMGQVMQQISASCQVICITHLPQIAAFGAHHFRVYKEDGAETTRSHITPLNPDERVEELAKMLSGAQLTEAAVENAKALLQSSHPA